MTSKSHRSSDVALDGILMSVGCIFDVERRVFISALTQAVISASTAALISASTSAFLSALLSTSTSAFLSASIHGHQNTSKGLMVVWCWTGEAGCAFDVFDVLIKSRHQKTHQKVIRIHQTHQKRIVVHIFWCAFDVNLMLFDVNAFDVYFDVAHP